MDYNIIYDGLHRFHIGRDTGIALYYEVFISIALASP